MHKLVFTMRTKYCIHFSGKHSKRIGVMRSGHVVWSHYWYWTFFDINSYTLFHQLVLTYKHTIIQLQKCNNVT